jgi:NAD(P)-dependent dehydrogenase (short-subunit alcohol dehydrogenase family)
MLKLLALVVLIVAVTWRPLFIWAVTSPYDDSIGTIPILSQSQLTSFYENKSALVVGGTRGTGFGTALALVKAGAHVTLVGRSEATGQNAIRLLKEAALSPNQRIRYQSGDIGTVRSTMELVEILKTSDARYDFLICSAGIFPDWNSLTNEDGLEKAYAIAVVGRFLLYRNMHHFLKMPHGRALNILASGTYIPMWIDRGMANGTKDPYALADALINFNTAHEVMLVGLDHRDSNIQNAITRVSTHPGVIVTELHQGQGWMTDVAMHLGELLLGISVEECGIRQASILASDALAHGKLSYVDPFMIGRKQSGALQKQVQHHLDWLWETLTKLEPRDKV